MNKQRRKAIQAVKDRFANEVQPLLDAIKGEIEAIRDEEQDAWDNLPESMQYGDKGDRIQEAIDALEEAADECDDFDFDLITDPLDTAAE